MAWSNDLTKNTKLALAKTSEEKKKAAQEINKSSSKSSSKSSQKSSGSSKASSSAWSKSVTARTDTLSGGGKGGDASVDYGKSKGTVKTSSPINSGSTTGSLYEKLHNTSFSSGYDGYKGYQSGNNGRRVFTPSSVSKSRNIVNNRDMFGNSLNERRRFVPSSNQMHLRDMQNRASFTNLPTYKEMTNNKRQRENNTAEWFRNKYNNGSEENNQIMKLSMPYNRNDIYLRKGVMNAIDEIAEDESERNKYKRADKLDDLISKMGLTPNELANAKVYANLKKLDFMSGSNGRNSVEKELTQPIAKFLAGARDTAEKTATFLIRDGLKLNGDFTQEQRRIEEYYKRHPEELGKDFFDRPEYLNDAGSNYLTNLDIEKLLERYNDTTKPTQFISDYGFRSAGQMAGAGAISQMSGLAQAAGKAGQSAKMLTNGTKIGNAVSKAAAISPKIANVSNKGLFSKAANAAINKANSISVGSAAKFLNPFDNPTTAIMGINAAQDKFDDLKRRGYDDDTAMKNALYSGYISAITEKMGFDGNPTGALTLKSYLNNVTSEGVEEVYNTALERLGEKVQGIGYQDEDGQIQERPFFGNEGVIDIKELLKSGAGGAIGGLVMGTPGVASQAINNYNDTVNIGRDYKAAGVAQDIINEGLRSKEDTAAYKYADKLQGKNNLSDWNIGRQVIKNEAAIDAEQRQAEALMNATEVRNETVDRLQNNANGAAVITPDSSRVLISDNRQTSYPETISHEYTHILKQLAPEQFQRYEDYVNSVTRLSNMAYENGEISEETAAIIAEKFAPTAEQIEKVLSGDYTIADKALDAIDAISARIKDKLGKTQKTRFNGDITNKDLRQARKLWYDALKVAAENNRQTAAAIDNSNNQTEVKYSPIEENSKGKYVQADRQVISGDNPNAWENQIYNYINDKIRNGQDVVIPTDDGDKLTISEKTAWKMGYRNEVRNADGTSRNMTGVEYQTKLNAAAHIDELAEISKRGKNNVADTKNHDFAQSGFNYRIAYFRDLDGQYYKLTVSVGENAKNKIVYNIGKIERVPFPAFSGSKTSDNVTSAKRNSYTDSISDNSGNVKYSLNENTETDNDAAADMSINDIINSDMPNEEKTRLLEERMRRRERSGRDLYAEGLRKGMNHFENMYKIQDSNYSEDSWESFGEEFGLDHIGREMQRRYNEAEQRMNEAERNDRRDNDNMSEQDWDNLLYGDEAQRQEEIRIRQRQAADQRHTEQVVRALMEEQGVTSPSELAPDTVSREESEKGRRVFRGATTVRNVMSHAYTAVVDDMHPFFNFNKAYEKATGTTNYGKDNPYKLAINAKDAASRAAYIVSDKMVDFDNNEIGKGLIETITDSGIKQETYKDFNNYLVAKHAVEWLNPNEHGTFKNVYNDERLDNMEVAEAIANDFEAKHPEFKQAAENLYAWQRQLMKTWLVDTGVITEKQYNQFTEMYPNYVPFFREDNSFTSGGSLSFANDGNPIRNAIGTMERRILEPIENIMYNTASYVNYATKHSVMKSAVNLYDILENDSENNILRQYWEEVYPINPEENNPQYFRTRDSQTPDIQDATQDEGNTISQTLQNQLNIRNGVIAYTDNGNTRYFKVNDKDFFTVLDNAKAGKFDGILATLASISRVRAALITSWNPAFSVASNPVRDFGTLILNSTDANKLKITKDALTSYVDIAKKSGAYKQYLSMGGQYSSVTTEGMDNMKKALQKLQDKDPNMVKRFFEMFPKMFNAYQTISDAIESSPRMAEFKSTLDKGYDYHEAFYRAKDVTTNFSRGGKISKELNAISNFFNASIQGVDKYFRQAKNNPKSFATGFACLTAVGLLAWAWNTMGDDEEKDEAYENLSNYAKNNAYNFYIGNGKFISILKARESAVLTTAIEATLDKLVKGEDDRFKGFFADYVLNQFLPDGSIIGYSTMNDLRANKDFKDSPIIPSSMEDLPKELQYDDSTSYLAKWLGGILKRSPKQIDYIINSEAGVLGKVNKTYFTPKAKQDKAAMFTLGASNTFRKDSLFSTDKLNMFYDNKDYAEKQANGYPNAENEYLSKRFAQSSKVLSLLNEMYKEDSLSDAGREIRRAYVNFANANKDNPTGYSDEVYNKIKDLFDTDASVLALPSVSRDIKTKDGNYTINNAKTLLNYQKDLNFNVDEAYRKLLSDVQFNAMPETEKVKALDKAKTSAVDEVKQFYVENNGKKMFSSDTHTAITKPKAEEIAAYNEKTEYHNEVSQKIQTVADKLAAAVPDKAGDYSAKSLTEFDIKSGKINGKSYDITGDVKNKVTEAAADEYYSNIDKLMNNEITIESVIGYTSAGKAHTSTQADGTKVNKTGKLYNDDGTPRFDELVMAKILRDVKEKAKETAINKYAAEISGGDEAPPSEPTEPIKTSKATGTTSAKRKSSGGGSGKKTSSGGSRSVADILSSLETTAYAADLDNYTPSGSYSGSSGYSGYSGYSGSSTSSRFRATDTSSAPRYVSYGKRSYTLNSALQTRYAQAFNRYFDGYRNLLSNDNFDVSDLLQGYDKGTFIRDLTPEQKERVMNEAKELADKNTQAQMQEDIEKNGTPKFTPTSE